MFGRKKKVILTDEEKRIIFYALNDFRTELLNEGRYVDVINEAMGKVKTKMKADRYVLGAIINALVKRREKINVQNNDTSMIDDLILRLLKIHETLK